MDCNEKWKQNLMAPILSMAPRGMRERGFLRISGGLRVAGAALHRKRLPPHLLNRGSIPANQHNLDIHYVGAGGTGRQ